MTQHLEALAKGNMIRTYRSDLKCKLSEGRVAFADVDLDDPLLQTMEVEALLRALPWRGAPRKARTHLAANAHARPRKVLYAMQLPSTARIGSLSPARKEELKEQVSRICPSQRRVPK